MLYPIELQAQDRKSTRLTPSRHQDDSIGSNNGPHLSVSSAAPDRFCCGEMAERTNASVLKTVGPLRVPGVRIPLSPPSPGAAFGRPQAFPHVRRICDDVVVKRFDPAGLYEAIDAERRRREMNWRQVADEIGVSASTITRTRHGGRMEVDGMLQMVGWLGLPVEHFVRETDL